MSADPAPQNTHATTSAESGGASPAPTPDIQHNDDLAHHGGWVASAGAWIDAVERDTARMMLDPLMLRLCGEVAGKRVIDVGCGEGRFSRMLAERGAKCVGIDPTPELLAAARDKGGIAPVRAIAESMPLLDASFDLAVSYITLVDIEGYVAAIAEMSRLLRPGGLLLAANIGFVSASKTPNGGWQRDDEGNALFVPIDNYASEWSAVYDWSGIRIRNWHRPLGAYMRAYLDAGLILRHFSEPLPPEPLRAVPEAERAFRVPWFTVMLWEKSPG